MEKQVGYHEANGFGSDDKSSISTILDSIHQNLKLLSTDYKYNLSILVKLAGEYLGADCVYYNRYSDNSLQNISAWQTPEDFIFPSDPKKSICFDMLDNSPDDFYHISDLSASKYATRRIMKYGYKSCLGHKINLEGKFRGMIGAFFLHDYQPTMEAKKIIEFVAVLIGLEEARYAVSESYRASESNYKQLYTMLRLICDNEPDMIWAKDIQGRYIFANKAMCNKLLEATDTDEPVGKTDHFFAERSCRLHDGEKPWCNNADKCQETDMKTIAAQAPQQFEEIYYLGGELRILDVHKAPLYSDDGLIIGTVGSARDVTEAKAVAKALAESQARYSALLEANPDVMFLFNSQGGHSGLQVPR